MERVGYRHPLTSRSSQLKSFSRQNVLCPASVSLFTEWHHFHDVGRELMKSRWGFAWPLHCLPWKLPAHTHTQTRTNDLYLPMFCACCLCTCLSVHLPPADRMSVAAAPTDLLAASPSSASQWRERQKMSVDSGCPRLSLRLTSRH